MHCWIDTLIRYSGLLCSPDFLVLKIQKQVILYGHFFRCDDFEASWTTGMFIKVKVGHIKKQRAVILLLIQHWGQHDYHHTLRFDDVPAHFHEAGWKFDKIPSCQQTQKDRVQNFYKKFVNRFS